MEENKKNVISNDGTDENVTKEEVCRIEIIDSKGYDIEQFLCRCSNKTSSTGF